MESQSLNLCKYKDLLGKPGEGLHSYRVFDIAILDTILTIVLGLLLAKIFNITKFHGILLSFLLGIVFHKIFCVETTINKLLRDRFKVQIARKEEN